MKPCHSETMNGITIEAFQSKSGDYIRIEVTVPLPNGGTRTTGFPIELKKAYPKEHA